MAMHDLDENLRKYARILVSRGINLQPGETTVLYISIDQYKLAHYIVDEIYAKGGARVLIEWSDDYASRAFAEKAPGGELDKVLPHILAFDNYVGDELPNRLYITSSDPDIYTGIEPARIAAILKARHESSKRRMEATMSDRLKWCVASAASPAWAKKVFPHLNTAEAQMDALWETILKTSRIAADDPDANWEAHLNQLRGVSRFLNEAQFDSLHYTDNGTDLTIGLPENHIWASAQASRQKDGLEFLPNMPTEEVFTSPDYRRVNGYVYSTKPLVYAGTPILDMKITFNGGKVAEYSASSGVKALETLLATDEGSKYLGEVALVPYNTPISESGILFYNTLFDENASNHLAFGAAYPNTVGGGAAMTKEQLKERGLNQSDSHEDFMIGSATTNIDGVKKDGALVPLFRNGNWVEEIINWIK